MSLVLIKSTVFVNYLASEAAPDRSAGPGRERGMMTDDRLERAITAFGRAAALLDGPRLHVWDERGLSLPQLRILFRVRQAPGIGAKELAALLGVSASNVTQQVDKLTSRGLVARTDRPGDRRHIALTLTTEGEQVAGEY